MTAPDKRERVLEWQRDQAIQEGAAMRAEVSRLRSGQEETIRVLEGAVEHMPSFCNQCEGGGRGCPVNAQAYALLSRLKGEGR